MKSALRTIVLAVPAILILSAPGAVAEDPTPPPPPAPAAAPAPTPPPPPAVPPAAMVDEAKIYIEDKAKGDGKIDIVITPKGGAAGTVTVLVSEKTKDKEVAEELAKNLAVTLGEGYKVEANGNTVKIKGKDKNTFAVSVGAITVPGMSVKIK